MPEENILIVEDESIIALSIQNSLHIAGYRVAAITISGEAAIDYAREHRPDLALVDITLAGKMDGIATAEILRSELDIPIIYMTALSDEKTLNRAQITLPYAYLVKPFQERDLRIAIQIALYNHQLESKLRQRTQELEAIQLVSTAIRSALALDEIYPIFSEQLRTLFKAHASAIALALPEQNELRIEMGQGEWAQWQGQRVSAQETTYAQIIATRRPAIGAGLPLDEQSAAGFTIGVPLTAFQNVIGVLFLATREPLNADQVRLLAAISDIAANAIHRQTLHQRLEEQYRALKTAQQQLVQSEKLAALGKMITGIAHEVNNPLASILLYAQILQQQPPASEIQSKSLDKIVQEAHRAAHIVRGLLDFAGQRPAHRKPTQVNDAVKLSLDLAQAAPLLSKIQFETHLADDLPVTQADPLQLQQVFLNLINNACQAIVARIQQEQATENNTARPPALYITSQFGPPLYVLDRSASRPVIRVIFQDNGTGISPDIMPHIFDPFFTTYQNRTGLGLSICHGILAEHNGRIWAESQFGQGATFFVELPVVTEKPLENLEDPG